GAMLDDMERTRLFDELLFGRCSSARAYWEQRGRPDLCADPWRAVSIRAPIDRVRAAIDDDADVRGFCFVLVVHTDDECEIGGARVGRVVRGGVRLFVDVSPRGLAGSWVRRIAPDVDVISIDGTVTSLANAAAGLFVAGVDVDVTKLAAIGPAPQSSRTMRVE